MGVLKKILLCSICISNYCLLPGQTSDKPKFTGELQIGDKMPDIPLGTVVNNKTGKKKFSELKGKLVILDFWFTGCTSCIEAFPKMEKLQKQFGDAIQIFLVNPWESQEQIEKVFSKVKNTNTRLPDLPSIVSAKELVQLFPLSYVPHHVWVDKTGTIRIRGSQLSTYEEKITDLLSGKEILSINDDNSSLPFDDNTPYYNILEQTKTAWQTGSFITSFNNNYAAANGGISENIIDSTLQTIRNTYINQEILELYRSAFTSILSKNITKTIFSAHKEKNMAWLDYFLLFVDDTTKYTLQYNQFRDSKSITDKDYIKSRFCYEQITPLKLSEQQRSQYMVADLNRYFINLYGIEARLEVRKQPSYVVTRVSDDNKLKTNNRAKGIDTLSKDGIKVIRYSQVKLKDVLWDLLSKKNIADFFSINNNTQSLFVFDETGIDTPITIVLPEFSQINTLENLQNALKPYDLKITKAERDIEFIVVGKTKL